MFKDPRSIYAEDTGLMKLLKNQESKDLQARLVEMKSVSDKQKEAYLHTRQQETLSYLNFLKVDLILSSPANFFHASHSTSKGIEASYVGFYTLYLNLHT